ncbi:MAG TPA: elongation factor P maturation arginine rhamnosyltransferase EarP, partial [Ramlibacter sp.]|nr:elongation factor P maturation arginine rhamnosyltransferase EarP [Ramlibacter sp.]
MLWDIFCKVIDNHGDIGVCWRLATQLAARGQGVRLWVDDASALAWMAPRQFAGVQVLPWHAQLQPQEPGGVVIEAFGCELAHSFQAAMAARTRERGGQPAWINLEYLTAESFAERSHAL